MAKSYPIFGQFNFQAQPGVGQMSKASRAVASFKKASARASAGAAQMGRGFRQLTMAGAVVGAGFGAVIKKAAGFNKQMSAVRSVAKGVTDKAFKQMTRFAMKMGATTAFTAVQAGEGMEELARQGLGANQVMAALPKTLALAAADSIDLKTSSQIVAASMGQFGLQADQAGRIADTLAWVSANSATNVTQLGEAMKYAGPKARGAGQSMESTAGAIGLLANIGIKGSMAGTALKNMFGKLSKQGKGFVKLFGSRAAMKNALMHDKKWLDISEIMKIIIGKLKKIPNQADRAKASLDMFGLRGEAALAAFQSAMSGKGDVMDNFAKFIGRNVKKAAVGTAEAMAKTRLDNLAGDWTLMKSAAEGAAIGLGNMLIKSFNLRDGIKGLTSILSKLGIAFQLMSDGASQSSVAATIGSKKIAAVAFGIKEGFQSAKEALVEVGATLKRFFSSFGASGDSTIKKITKIITKTMAFGAALAPIGVAFGGLSTVASGAFNVIGGGVKMVTALMSPWGLALTLILALFGETRKKGESTFSWLGRTLKSVAKAFSPIISAIKFLVKHLGVFGTLLGVGVAVQAGKMALRAGFARMAAGGGRGASLLGAAGALGQPVRVMNWHEAKMLGGIGGGAAGGAAVGTAATKGGWAAAAGKIFGTVAAVGLLAAAPSIGESLGDTLSGLLGVGTKAEHEKKFREQDRMIKAHIKKGGKFKRRETDLGAAGDIAGWFTGANVASRIAMPLDAMAQFRNLGAEWRAGKGKGRTLASGERVGVRETMKRESIGPLMQTMAQMIKGGEAAQAKAVWQQTGLASLKDWAQFAMDNESQAKKMGLNRKMIETLLSLDSEIKRQAEQKTMPMKVVVNVDGKQIAVANRTAQVESRERAGKPPAPGERRRAAQAGY